MDFPARQENGRRTISHAAHAHPADVFRPDTAANTINIIHPSQYLYRSPKQDDSRNGHPCIGSPNRNMQLLGKDKERANHTAQTNQQCHGMIFSQEYIVVAKHQQQIGRPQDYHQLHKSNDTCMACHRTGSDFILPSLEQQTLTPVDEVASVSSTENIHQHHHHPKAERGRQNKVFRSSDYLSG